MKVIAINKANNVFKGLWEKDKEFVTGTEQYCINKRIDKNYHAFADESKSSIQNALASKKYEVMVPTANNFEHEYYVSQPIEAKRLSFTEKEFLKYKRFYEKNLPESFKNIEKELAENGLAHYINGGKMFAIKKFLHKIKLI